MSERKVLNKYYPPDFDPSKIPRRKLGRDRQQVVRLMAPFSMRCNTCGEYVYKGKKFNARKETVQGETYYGIKIFRFYIKCPRCSAEITFKTDPKNTDYLAEHGASRNFEPWRDGEGSGMTDQEKLDLLEAQDALQAAQQPGAVKSANVADAGADASNPMAALESRTADSKREMDILDKLQEIRTRNARMERVGKGLGLDGRVVAGGGVDADLNPGEAQEEERRKREEEEIEEEVRRVFFARGAGKVGIELDEDLVPGEGEFELDGEGDDSASASTSAAPLPSEPAPPRPPPPPALASTSVKRKLADIEPDAVSLLPEETRKIVGTFSATAASGGSSKKSKKGEDLAKKLGIKVAKR